MTGSLTAPATGGGYALDNHHQAAPAHHRALAELLDPHTIGRIAGLRKVSVGVRCLEVGAGGGSIARWLAGQVGEAGEVVACDLKPEQIGSHPRLTTVAHDLQGPESLAGAVGTGFDLVVARLTLAHLPSRRTVLHRLAELLAPAGVLLVEDWAALRDDVVVSAPDPQAAALYQRYQHAAATTFDDSGADRSWACRIHVAMLEEGLAGVETVIHGGYWSGGGPGMRLVAAIASQLRPSLLAAGLSVAELDRLGELLPDPSLVVRGHPLYSTSGRRAG
jgi:SAM-dependent methyltransferase